MKLAEYLSTTGFTKASLAQALGVTRGAIQKWDDIPDDRLSELEGLVCEEVPMAEKEKNWNKYTQEEMGALIKRRGGIEGDSLRELETDYEIASSIGLKVFEFNLLIKLWCKNAGRS